MAWLEQREECRDLVLLQDYPDRVVRLDCPYCDRTGRYGLAGLVHRFGPAACLPDVLAALSADCPRRRAWRTRGPCGAGFPGRSRLRPSSMTPPSRGPTLSTSAKGSPRCCRTRRNTVSAWC